MGRAFLQLEHELNGKNNLNSRSWDFVSRLGKLLYKRPTFTQAKSVASVSIFDG